MPPPLALTLTRSIRAGRDKAGGRQNAGFWAANSAYVDHSLFDFQEWTRNKLPFSLKLITCWWACTHECRAHGKLYFSCTPIAHPVGSLEWKLREEEMSTSLHGVNLCAAAPVTWDASAVRWCTPLMEGQSSGGTILGHQSEMLFPPSRAAECHSRLESMQVGGWIWKRQRLSSGQAQSSEPSRHLEVPVWPGSCY